MLGKARIRRAAVLVAQLRDKRALAWLLQNVVAAPDRLAADTGMETLRRRAWRPPPVIPINGEIGPD
ncbi:MAG: hypothetical protein WD969_08025, partial [Paracoccaceae bacterium]